MSNVLFLKDITEEDYLEVFLKNPHHTSYFEPINMATETFFVPFKVREGFAYRFLNFREKDYLTFRKFKGEMFVDCLNFCCRSFEEEQWKMAREGIMFEKRGTLRGILNYV